METNDVILEEILQGCKKSQRASQMRLYAHFYNYVMTIARRYMADQGKAEEVANDAFFKVFTKIHLYSSDYPFRPWLRRIVVNTAIDRLRSEASDIPSVALQGWNEGAEEPNVVENLTREQIWMLLDRLPPAYRAVFNLAVVDGFSHEEIAQALEISVGASKSNLSRARQYLRKLLKQEYQFFN